MFIAIFSMCKDTIFIRNIEKKKIKQKSHNANPL